MSLSEGWVGAQTYLSMHFATLIDMKFIFTIQVIMFAVPLFTFSALAEDALRYKAIIYDGTGACAEGCAHAAAAMATRNGLIPVFVNEHTSTDGLFNQVAVWIQPGGYSSNVVTSVSAPYIAALQKFVREGGAYIGFCAGAFAATRYSGDVDYLGFNLMPGETSLYWNQGQMVAILPIQWGGKTRHVYFEGGPYLDHLGSNAEVVATYPNGQVAAARVHYGRGRVFLAGFHPEAPNWWREAYGLVDPDGEDFTLVDEMIAWVTQKSRGHHWSK